MSAYAWRPLLALALMCAAAPADDAPPAEAAETPSEATKPESTEARERSLFDGQSLEHWKVIDFAGGGEATVEEGSIVIAAGQPMSGIVWTGEELPKQDYELTFEARRIEGTDFFVGLTFPVSDAPCTLILGGWGGGLTGFSSIDGQDASENQTTNFMQFEKGRWYKVRLLVTKARIEAYVDDKRISGFDHRDRKLSVRIEVERSRPLGFSTFQTEGALKDLKLRTLTEDESKKAIEEANRMQAEKDK